MTKTQRKIRDYLLGNAAEPNLEKQLLTDDDLFEELLMQEEEIIDEYIKWQTTFLTTQERRWDLEFAQLFHFYLTNHAQLQSE
jgi:hypothetical protein